MEKLMIKKSTKDLWKLNGGWKHPLLFLHGYFYLAHTDWYVKLLVPTTKYLAKKFPESFGRTVLTSVQPVYHSKVLIPEHAKKLVNLDEDLRIDDAVGKKVITFSLARKIILENPESIVVVDCGCRTHVGKCASKKYGLNVCMVIGDPPATFLFEHSKLHPKRLTPQEAMERIDDCHENGFVHTFWFKDAMGYRSYALCNCCKCCCSAMLINNELFPMVGFKKQMILSSGYTAKVDEKKCRGCATCVKWCPFSARSVNTTTKVSETDYEKCHGCSVCVDKCPNGAITLVADFAKGIPFDIDAIKQMQP
jgi:Pyruvate/2-oxoacid:ferredoxin oxidoreductase delta subunit